MTAKPMSREEMLKMLRAHDGEVPEECSMIDGLELARNTLTAMPTLEELARKEQGRLGVHTRK
ncbi:hypothetical protein JS528_01175 [Bifidobacterium sp. MA2]|uniref:Uncharacterized protein n=1 Tax=Bifidobacterium santillanense TaxID=2809028 RepID=A0ABS5UMB7_9BIFI|nr:hypothetical protein [Bifidobacterium santillanense]MBT1171992.1 hypothetical protein [Bifidobacterium santillanense]